MTARINATRTRILRTVAAIIAVSVSVLSMLVLPGMAFADDLIDGKSYYDSLMSDSMGNSSDSKLGWDENLISNVNTYESEAGDVPSFIRDKLNPALQVTATTAFGTIIVIFVIKMAGRAAFNIFMPKETVPNFFLNSYERKEIAHYMVDSNNKVEDVEDDHTKTPHENTFRGFFRDFIVYFGIAFCAWLIITLILNGITYGFQLLASSGTGGSYTSFSQMNITN